MGIIAKWKDRRNILKRCKKYARQLNKINLLLDKYDNSNASQDCLNLINEIDLAIYEEEKNEDI